MKIKITEIEADASDLSASNTVADGLLAILRNAFNPPVFVHDDEEDDNGDSD